MIKRKDLNLYLYDLLDCTNFVDYAPNGLQVEGKEEITRIVTAVTASIDVIEQAKALQADAILVHHGYFWPGEDKVITGVRANRIGALLSNKISLFAYHLPLDCHITFGNNACIATLLKISSSKMHKAGKTDNLLWSGSLASPMTSIDFTINLQKIFKRTPLTILGHDRLINNIAWCSGAAQDFIEEASRLGVDAFISGEISERTYYQAKELGINYYACGHHATERYGIAALGEHLSSAFALEHIFVDSDNPV